MEFPIVINFGDVFKRQNEELNTIQSPYQILQKQQRELRERRVEALREIGLTSEQVSDVMRLFPGDADEIISFHDKYRDLKKRVGDVMRETNVFMQNVTYETLPYMPPKQKPLKRGRMTHKRRAVIRRRKQLTDLQVEGQKLPIFASSLATTIRDVVKAVTVPTVNLNQRLKSKKRRQEHQSTRGVVSLQDATTALSLVPEIKKQRSSYYFNIPTPDSIKMLSKSERGQFHASQQRGVTTYKQNPFMARRTTSIQFAYDRQLHVLFMYNRVFVVTIHGVYGYNSTSDKSILYNFGPGLPYFGDDYIGGNQLLPASFVTVGGFIAVTNQQKYDELFPQDKVVVYDEQRLAELLQ